MQSLKFISDGLRHAADDEETEDSQLAGLENVDQNGAFCANGFTDVTYTKKSVPFVHEYSEVFVWGNDKYG